ncbi:uncharacterized protein CLUP02_08885 [Colletotrichum lupini]|uniref:Uncharacterized protein n=1 Tax=Colletotrichum lupini TaxID=145971 RepID=A0A9Q8WI22_9PEZI|nr:uncharacterized protein CLUP02_08885 [Colletotrichum lupini]UQC83390.1 hypothetical protein CLUP02_08885 [Colletotrichum lupini]
MYPFAFRPLKVCEYLMTAKLCRLVRPSHPHVPLPFFPEDSNPFIWTEKLQPMYLVIPNRAIAVSFMVDILPTPRSLPPLLRIGAYPLPEHQWARSNTSLTAEDLI